MTGFKRFTPLVQSLPASVPFVGPETSERASGTLFKARIGANENGFGFSPLVQKTIEDEAHLSWRYGDPESFDLKNAICDKLAVDFNNIVIGEGIDGLLGLVARMIVETNTPVVTSIGAYPTFNFHVAGFGGQLHAVPYKQDKEDLDALLDKVQETNAALVYFANPDNPMGTYWSREEVVDFAKKLPASTMLILDEAYVEMAPDDAVPVMDAFLDMPNVLRMRTFSKAYGLAGLRVGYAIGHPDTILMFDRVRNHFGMSRLSQKAAVAAISDDDWLEKVLNLISSSRQKITKIVETHGFTSIPSATNFVTIDCGRDGDYAREILKELMERGIFVRMPGVAPLDRCIRVSVGPDEEIDRFAAALNDIMSKQK
ncbi:MAG: pyridoxal phosphate-dependent aminotransferase [Lentilitoribacter sp.]